MRYTLAALLLALTHSPAARCADVDLGGFFTVGYAKSNITNPYLRAIDKDGNFSRISDAGLLASAAVNERFSVKVQTVASGWPDQSFHFDLDLAQGRYLFSENWEAIFGRVRLPLFMISDYRLVGALYPWATPPAEVYDLLPLETVGSNETFNGINLIFKRAIWRGWELTTEVYGGGSDRVLTPPNETINAKAKRLFGTALSLSHGEFLWHASYLNSLNHSTSTQTSSSGTSTNDTSLGIVQLLGTGVRWEPGTWLLMGEFIRAFSENRRFESVYSYYESTGYHFFRRRLLLIGTVAGILNSSKTTEHLAQTSGTIGLNVMPDSTFVVKLEAQRIFPHAYTQTSGTNAPGLPPPPGAPQLPTVPGAPPPPAQGSGLFTTAQTSPLTVLYGSVSAAF